MKIIHKKDAINISKPEGTSVSYFLFDEYEIHYNEQIAGSAQTWHYHEKIWETIFIIEGELTAQWKESGELRSEVIKVGDVVDSENTSHTFLNNTDKPVKFLVFKQVLKGQNNRETFKNDKVVDEE